jgi:hypothetical protein
MERNRRRKGSRENQTDGAILAPLTNAMMMIAIAEALRGSASSGSGAIEQFQQQGDDDGEGPGDYACHQQHGFG